VNTTKRRGNSEGSNPDQRADGRWQFHIRHGDEDGVEPPAQRLRQHCQGGTRQCSRGPGSASGQPACEGSQNHTRRVHSRMARLLPRGIGSESNHEEPVRHDGSHTLSAPRSARNRSTNSGRPISTRGRWKLKGRGLAESSIRTAYTVLRAVLDTAVRDRDSAKPGASCATPQGNRQGGCLPDA